MPPEPVPRIKPSKRPRHRYVLFRLVRPSRLERGALVRALRAVGADGPSLTRFDGAVGVLRCRRGTERTAARLLREGLGAHGVEAEPLSTSGTLAALERRYRSLDLAGQRG